MAKDTRAMAWALLATRRRKWLLALAIVLALALGPYLVGRGLSQFRQVSIHENAAAVETPPPASTLRVLTYNIAHGRGARSMDNWEGTAEEKRARIARIAQLIAETDADIVVLNEVDFRCTWSGHQNQAAAIAQAAGYPYWVEQRNLDLQFLYGSWKFGNAILSRVPIVAAEPLDLPPRAAWEHVLAGSKQGVVATVELPDKRQLRVAAIHFDTRGEALRVASALALLEAVVESDVPLLAAGDFNSTPSSYPLSRQSETGENALDLLLASEAFTTQPLCEPALEELTFRSFEPINAIDWVLIPADWELAEYRVLDSQHSDHRPVIAEIELPAQ